MSPAGWRATWWTPAIGVCRPRSLREAKHRILDTLAAMVSGARLKPGVMAIQYVRGQGGVPEASVLTTDIRTSAVNAALANGMFGHADETDDFEPVTKAHPGCAVVPAALAMAEREDRSGTELLRAVTLGYDLCCRFLLALGADLVRATHRSAEGVSATFGSAAAAASLARLDERAMRYALSYAAQQVSGVWSWERDTEHVEKAFDFAGMGARNGVTAAMMVQSGFTGVPDVLDGEHNVLEAFSTAPKPEEMVAGLGSRFFVTDTAIKIFSVGYPIQAPLDAFLILRREHGLTVNNVARIVVKLPADGARIVDNRAMPDVNVQHMMAVALDRRHGLVRSQPLVRAHGGRASPGGEGPCAAGRRSRVDGSGGAAQRAGGGDASRWPDGEPLHAACSGHQRKPAGYGGRERESPRSDGAGARRGPDRSAHPARERAGGSEERARAAPLAHLSVCGPSGSVDVRLTSPARYVDL